MKKSIEIIEAFLEECDRDLNGEICLKCDGLTRNAIEHILSDYKKQPEMKENIEEDIKRISNLIDYVENADYVDVSQCFDSEDIQAIDHVISNYKRVLKENEELKHKYNSLIDKIILKIDEYDYKFEKAKRQNKNDIADYYWDLIGNFKKLLSGE